jgi:hypothetical protein
MYLHMSCDSSRVKESCDYCAKVCEDCAKECERHDIDMIWIIVNNVRKSATRVQMYVKRQQQNRLVNY